MGPNKYPFCVPALTVDYKEFNDVLLRDKLQSVPGKMGLDLKTCLFGLAALQTKTLKIQIHTPLFFFFFFSEDNDSDPPQR
jgi:hypothetical protein